MVVYHGEIASLIENITSKLNNLNKNKNISSQINIRFAIDSGSESQSLKITYLAGYTIYHSIQKSILNILILTTTNKSNDKSNDNITNNHQYSEIIIPIESCSRYNIEITSQYECSVSKKVKKCLIDKVDISSSNTANTANTSNTSNTFYVYDNQYILMVDSLGKFYYFPDSINLDTNTTNPANTTNLGIELPIDLNLDSYKLYDLTQKQTDILDYQNKSPNTNTNTIASLLSWLNPLSYIYTYSNTNTDSNTDPNTDPNELVMIRKSKYYFIDGEILITPDTNANHNGETKTKRLKMHEIQIPCHIVNIYKNPESGNIILEGVMDESRQNVSITFNKYLLNPIVQYGV